MRNLGRQKLAPIRVGNTCWGSHYKSLRNASCMFHSIVDVLEIIKREGDISFIGNDAN